MTSLRSASCVRSVASEVYRSDLWCGSNARPVRLPHQHHVQFDSLLLLMAFVHVKEFGNGIEALRKKLVVVCRCMVTIVGQSSGLCTACRRGVVGRGVVGWPAADRRRRAFGLLGHERCRWMLLVCFVRTLPTSMTNERVATSDAVRACFERWLLRDTWWLNVVGSY